MTPDDDLRWDHPGDRDDRTLDEHGRDTEPGLDFDAYRRDWLR